MKLKLCSAIISIATIITLSSCDNLKMTNEEATSLVRQAVNLNVPQHFQADIGINGMGQARELNALSQEGVLTWTYQNNFGGFPIYLVTLNMPDHIKQYYLGKNKRTQFDVFKTNDFDLDQITGISINKNDQTATVRFTLKATNVTPIGQALNKNNLLLYKVDRPANGELVFKKFDNGWQLQSDINLSSDDRLMKILKAANQNNNY